MFCDGEHVVFLAKTKHSMNHVLYKSALLIHCKIDPVGVLGVFLHEISPLMFFNALL